MNQSAIKIARSTLNKISKNNNTYLWYTYPKLTLRIIECFYLSKTTIRQYCIALKLCREVIRRFIKGKTSKGSDWIELQNLIEKSAIINFYKSQTTTLAQEEPEEKDMASKIQSSKTTAKVELGQPVSTTADSAKLQQIYATAKKALSEVQLSTGGRRNWENSIEHIEKLLVCFMEAKVKVSEFCNEVGLYRSTFERFLKGTNVSRKPWPPLKAIIAKIGLVYTPMVRKYKKPKKIAKVSKVSKVSQRKVGKKRKKIVESNSNQQTPIQEIVKKSWKTLENGDIALTREITVFEETILKFNSAEHLEFVKSKQ